MKSNNISIQCNMYEVFDGSVDLDFDDEQGIYFGHNIFSRRMTNHLEIKRYSITEVCGIFDKNQVELSFSCHLKLCELNITCTSTTAESRAKIWYQ